MSSSIHKSEFHEVGELIETPEGVSIRLIFGKPLKRILKHLMGKKLEVGFKELKYQRSSSQNRYLWGVMYVTIASFLKSTQGRKVSKEDIHEYTIQHNLNDGSTGKVVAFDLDEFESFVNDMYTLAHRESREDFISRVHKFSTDYTSNMTVSEVLGKRILTHGTIKRTKNLNTKEFAAMVEAVQDHWKQMGCVIPNPKKHNYLSEYINEDQDE